MEIEIRRTWETPSNISPEIIYHLRYLTTGENDSCWNKDTTGEKPALSRNMQKIISLALIKIDGLSVRDENGKITPIVTAKDLFGTPALSDFFYELYSIIETNSARVDPKN